jgi:hypothetical protein
MDPVADASQDPGYACGHASAQNRSHVRIVAGASQKLYVDERFKQCLRLDWIESPEPLDLRLRQTQAWNLEIFSAYELEPLIDVRVSR